MNNMENQKREAPEGLKAGMGVCKFCGQMRAFEDVGGHSQEELDEAATNLCVCPQGEKYRLMEKRRVKITGKIRDVFEKLPVMEKIMEYALEDVVKGQIIQISILDSDGVRGSIKMGAGGDATLETKKVITNTEKV